MQLVMTKMSLAALGPVTLPEGYKLRHFRTGEDKMWERVLDDSFGAANPPRLFSSTMGCDAACVPERILFVTKDDIPVATASAWYVPAWGALTGYVHYVGVCNAHSGRKLGYWVSLAVLHRFVFEGRARAVLQTDDHRVPAIKTYLQLGFKPFLVEDDQRKRWRTVINENRFQSLCPELEQIVSGPVHQCPEPLQ